MAQDYLKGKSIGRQAMEIYIEEINDTLDVNIYRVKEIEDSLSFLVP